MFRRRRFRYERRPPWARPGFDERAWKARGPIVPGAMLHPRLQRELRRANHLLAIGDHLNAGQIFQSLAETARDRDFIYPAPMLFMQAAHAFLFGESFAPSLENAQTGLGMLAEQQRWRALNFEGHRYIEELEASSQKEEAQKLREWLELNLKGQPVDQTAAAESEDKALPEKCPYCGASMSIEQMHAAGGKAAECLYCGSVVMPREAE